MCCTLLVSFSFNASYRWLSINTQRAAPFFPNSHTTFQWIDVPRSAGSGVACGQAHCDLPQLNTHGAGHLILMGLNLACLPGKDLK